MKTYRQFHAHLWKSCSLIFWIFLTLLPVLATFGFSSQDAAHSGALSLQVLLWLLRHFPRLSSLGSTAWLHGLIRKLAHFSLYFVLGCGLRGLCAYQKRFPVIPCSVALGALYAAFDELHQHFSKGRAPSLFDVGIDTCGVIMGCTLVSLLFLLFRRKSPRKA